MSIEAHKFVSLYPPETPKNVLPRIREQLQSNNNVHFSGEVSEARYRHSHIDSYTSANRLIVAPTKPVSIFELDYLNRFAKDLIHGIKPVEAQYFKPYLGQEVSRDYEYAGIDIAQLDFTEDVGLRLAETTDKIIPFQPEVLQEMEVDTREQRKMIVDKITRKTRVTVYPDPDIADLILEYIRDVRLGNIREIADGSCRVFQDIQRYVKLPHLDSLHNGSLKKKLEYLRQRSSKK